MVTNLSPPVWMFIINPLCEVSAGANSNRSIRRRTTARCMSIYRSSLFSRTSIFFSALAKHNSLQLTETHCAIMSLQFALGFLRSNVIFSKKWSKSVLLLRPPWKPWKIILFSFLLEEKKKMADDSNQLDCPLPELSLHGKSEFK